MLAHCNLKQNMCLPSKQSSLFSFYALPSGGKSKGAMSIGPGEGERTFEPIVLMLHDHTLGNFQVSVTLDI